MKAVVTVIGVDTVGIIAGVSTILADAGANILDLSQTIMQTNIFAMTMLVDVSNLNITFEKLSEKLEEKGKTLGLEIRIQREELFLSMHRI